MTRHGPPRLCTFVALGATGLAAFATPVRAQRDTVTVEQRVLLSPDLSSAEAKRRAIGEGLAEAVRRVAGVRVQSTALSVLDERGGILGGGWSSVVQLDAAARAVDYRVVDDEFVSAHHPQLGAQLYYRARLLVSVERESGAPDPSFTAEAELDARVYTARGRSPADGDEIRGVVRVSRPSFISVFVVTDDSAERVVPNDYVRELRAAPGATVHVPPAEWRARGVRLRASLADGRDRSRSLFMVVATLDAIAPPPATATVLDVQRWLVRIPADRRTIAFAPFETVR